VTCRWGGGWLCALAIVCAASACPRPSFVGRPCHTDKDCVDETLACVDEVCRGAEGEGED
jgi:hypothetical protein